MSFHVIEDWQPLDHPADSSNRTIIYRVVDMVGFDGLSTVMQLNYGGKPTHVGGIRPSDHKPNAKGSHDKRRGRRSRGPGKW